MRLFAPLLLVVAVLMSACQTASCTTRYRYVAGHFSGGYWRTYTTYHHGFPYIHEYYVPVRYYPGHSESYEVCS